jgi:hypothetical protein
MTRRKRKREEEIERGRPSAQYEDTSANPLMNFSYLLQLATDVPESVAKQNNSLTSTSTQVNVERALISTLVRMTRVHGVTYSIVDIEGWTPVIGIQRAEICPLRFRTAPHVKAVLPPSDESTSY